MEHDHYFGSDESVDEERIVRQRKGKNGLELGICSALRHRKILLDDYANDGIGMMLRIWSRFSSAKLLA
jgi:hypothetical protein